MVLSDIATQGQLYGGNTRGSFREPDDPRSDRKSVMVEFSSPNIGMPLSATTLRCTILGEYVASLYTSMGWEVFRWSYLGDWGRHLWLLAVGLERYGWEPPVCNPSLERLFNISAKMDQQFSSELDKLREYKKMERDTSEIETQGLFADVSLFEKRVHDGDHNAKQLVAQVRNLVSAAYMKEYTRLNIAFDSVDGESSVSPHVILEVESSLKELGLCQESGGCLLMEEGLFKGTHYGRVLRTSRSTTYFLREIASALDRSRNPGFDKMVYVTSIDQKAHFSRVHQTLDYLGFSDVTRRLEHVYFSPPKPRSFEALCMQAVLDRFQKAARDLVQHDKWASRNFARLSHDGYDILGTTALRVQVLSEKRLSFRSRVSPPDPDRLGDFAENSGLRLQWWYLRLSSALSNTGIDPLEGNGECSALFDGQYVSRGRSVSDCIRLLIQFPNVVKSSFDSLEPSTILKYLFRLVDELSIVLDDDTLQLEPTTALGHATLRLLGSIRQVLENGMRILGIVPLGIAYLQT
jgi:arginyl-tRNA synthetase